MLCLFTSYLPKWLVDGELLDRMLMLRLLKLYEKQLPDGTS